MPENEKAATMCSCFSPPTKPFYIISLETKTKSEADFIQAELRLLMCLSKLLQKVIPIETLHFLINLIF